jgi:hypothetical protein
VAPTCKRLVDDATTLLPRGDLMNGCSPQKTLHQARLPLRSKTSLEQVLALGATDHRLQAPFEIARGTSAATPNGGGLSRSLV